MKDSGAATPLPAGPQSRLLVCVGPRCDAEGRGRALFEALRRCLPEEKRGALQTRDCLRLCCGEPVVRIEPSGDVFANPGVDDLMRLVGARSEG